MNPFVWVIVAAVLGLVFVLFFPQYLHRNTDKNRPGFGAKWFARHPDGQVSTVEHYYTNENGKLMWKFSEWPQEVRAEFDEDVIVEKGAWQGNAALIFRYNRNGSEIPWENPWSKKHFEEKKVERKARRNRFLERLKLEDYDKFSSSIKGAHESKRLSKKYVDTLISKQEKVERSEVKADIKPEEKKS